MKEINIKIIGSDIYINDNLHKFDYDMDKENHEDDLNKKVLVALANEMDYEPVYLFEEIANRLDEILDECNEIINRDIYI